MGAVFRKRNIRQSAIRQRRRQAPPKARHARVPSSLAYSKRGGLGSGIGGTASSAFVVVRGLKITW